jgi:hypothetical protein
MSTLLHLKTQGKLTMKLYIFLATFFVASTAFGDNHPSPSMLSLEVNACTFKKNKDFDDFRRVLNEWDSWADDNLSKPYNAIALTPYAFTGSDLDFDLIMLGVSGDHHSMGVINDEWDEKGYKLQEKFDAVCAGAMHFYATSLAVKTFPQDDTPSRLTVASCQYREGKGFKDLAAADAKWSSYMAEVGIPGGLYRWFPNAGYPRASEDDYMQVYVTASQADFGKTMDMMWAGSYPVFMQTYDDIQVCDNTRIYASQWEGGNWQ